MTDTAVKAIRENDRFGFPIGTRWIRCTAFDAAGKTLGSATADMLDFPDTAHANSACVSALIRHYGALVDTHRVSWGD